MSGYGNRDWMYAPRTGLNKTPDWFVDGVDQFIDFCLNHPEWMRGSDMVVCPCKLCRNCEFQDIDLCRLHLYRKGFVEEYRIWFFQGEPRVGELNS